MLDYRPYVYAYDANKYTVYVKNDFRYIEMFDRKKRNHWRSRGSIRTQMMKILQY